LSLLACPRKLIRMYGKIGGKVTFLNLIFADRTEGVPVEEAAARFIWECADNINGKEDLRKWQNADFLHGMELFVTQLKKTCSILLPLHS